MCWPQAVRLMLGAQNCVAANCSDKTNQLMAGLSCSSKFLSGNSHNSHSRCGANMWCIEYQGVLHVCCRLGVQSSPS